MMSLTDFFEKDKAIMNIIKICLILVVIALIIIIIVKDATVGNLIFIVVVILALIFGYNLKGVLNKESKNDRK